MSIQKDSRIISNSTITKLWSIIKNLTLLLFILVLCTFIAMYFNHINMFESNFVMVYLLGILIYSYLAGGYIYSFFASICGVLFYNYFFTEPYYSLQVYNSDYPLTFIIMFTVGFITSMLTLRIKYESHRVAEREEKLASLYDIGKNLLEVSSIKQLATIMASKISTQFQSNTLIQIYDTTGSIRISELKGVDLFTGDIDKTAILEAYQSGSPCGHGTNLFSESNGYYTPILSQNGVLGIIGIALENGHSLTQDQITFLDAIVPQIAVVLERERLYEKQQDTQLEIQGERLRADMLRAISHDLRTPLTGIMGLTITVLNNYDVLDEQIKKEFLSNIYDEADWLNELVENILQTTRFEEGKVKLNLEQEAAEEIITEAVAHVKKRFINHIITVKMPDELILFYVDGILIRQVLINLLNNAINYSPIGSEIIVANSLENNHVIFEVIDNGPGIKPIELPHIFDRYYQKTNKSTNNRKGIGIGLSLCKSIVEAHGGRITICNGKPHGTIARFIIPLKGD